MGAYVYKTKPSEVAVARVELPGGEERDVRVALYRYAYKPVFGDDLENRILHFRSGAQSCENGWKSSGVDVPVYGITISKSDTLDSTTVVPFFTEGSPSISDVEVKQATGVTIKSWLRLPKKVKIAVDKGSVLWDNAVSAKG